MLVDLECSHNYIFTQGCFECTKCGKCSYGRSNKGKQWGEITAGIIVGFVVVLGIFAYSNGILEINQENLEQSLHKIYDSVPVGLLDDTTNAISEIKIPESAEKIIDDTADTISKIEIPDVPVSPPIRLESGFDSALIEKYIFELTNDERQQRGFSSLTRVSAIDSIARNHSLDMSNRNYFSHYSPEGNDPTDRGNMVGYTCKKDYGSYYTEGLGENIFLSPTYSSYMTKGATLSYNWLEDEEIVAKGLVDGWMDSPGHRENILDGQYDRIGVGVVINSDEYVYSTQNFC